MGNISEFFEEIKMENKWHLFPFQKLASECLGEGLSGLLLPFKCDLTNEEEIVSMFSAVKQQHGGVDVCINNAGLAHPESLLSGKTSSWRNMLDVRASNGAIWSWLERHKRWSQGQLTRLSSLGLLTGQRSGTEHLHTWSLSVDEREECWRRSDHKHKQVRFLLSSWQVNEENILLAKIAVFMYGLAAW